MAKKVAQPKAENTQEVVTPVVEQEDLYVIPQSLPIQERSRNATRRSLHNWLVEKKWAADNSTPANPKSITLTKAQMAEVEQVTADLIEAHFAETEYTDIEIAQATKQLSEKQAAKCGGTITVAKLRKNTENFYVNKFSKADHFPVK